ncbi:MAG: exodeoxyribonuclease VII large subunit [Wenzhouxiangella sp.]
MTIPAPGPEARIFAPAELNQEARIHLEAGFPRLWVRGEISNLARPASGHLYFSLKDVKAQIRCALFRGHASGIGFRPQNGDQVLVRGRLSLYEPRGDYQLIADGLLAAGAGELQAAFEALKKKLEAEGLFAPERKKPLPMWPQRLAVVTSPSGAAVRDILHVLAQRWPLIQVRIYSAQVQGEAAPGELIRALRAADSDDFADLILLARGGGSLEDLWAFNDEQLARVIANLRRPVISGVGHETDFTIADFVADLRAPTPSAAAAAATPDGPALRARIHELITRIQTAAQRRLQREAQTVDNWQRRLQAHSPNRRLQDMARRRIELERRLVRAMRQSRAQHQQRLGSVGGRLQQASPARRIESLHDRGRTLQQRLLRAMERQLERSAARLASQARALDSISPLKVLERGYAVVRDPAGAALTRIDQFRPDQDLTLRFRHFEVPARVSAAPRKDPKTA